MSVAAKVAAFYHNDWLEGYRKENPDTKQRFKPLTLPDGSKTTVNILQPAEAIPEWINDQTAIFQEYVDAVNSNLTVDENAAIVHQIWMRNNEFDRVARPNVFKPFAELDLLEQEKDRMVVRIILEDLV